MNRSELQTAVDLLGHPRALVLGDLILDRYTWGDATAISPEAAVIRLRANKREVRPGGAANVCQMLRGLEAEVAVAATIGLDAAGQTLRNILSQAGVADDMLLVDAARPTTVKERFIAHAAKGQPHQILRVDSEVRDPLSDELQKELAGRICARIADFDILLISDYDKGVCTPELLASVIQAAQRADVPVLVDPIRITDYSRYAGATTMTPNRLEAEWATSIRIDSLDSAYAAGRRLCASLGLEWAVVTLDRDGMALVHADGRAEHFPTRPREVYDITGAGDMVLATIGVALAAGLEIGTALQLANIAGGLEVEQVGVVPISRDEIRIDLLSTCYGGAQKHVSLEHAARLGMAHRNRGQRVVFTEGRFDILNINHLAHLTEAADQGDVLIVGLQGDPDAAGSPTAAKPIIRQEERMQLLCALSCVDYVLLIEDACLPAVLQSVRPDVLVLDAGYQQRSGSISLAELVTREGGRIHVTRTGTDDVASQIEKRLAA